MRLTKDDQAALVTFSHVVALAAAHGFGETSLVDGVYAAMMVGESDVGRALLIVFSDGLDTASWLSADVSYTPRGVARDGWHRLDVRVKNRRVTIKARPGYLAGL
jgi:hypothetical protein